MKLIRFIYLLIFMVATGCKKEFLDVPNNSSFYRQNYVKDLRTTKEYLNGVYYENAFSMQDGAAVAYAEVIADNLRPSNTINGRLLSQYTWKQKAGRESPYGLPGNGTAMNGMWSHGYRLIRAASFVIEAAKGYRNENESMANDLQAQALAMRAYVHFRMVSMFAQHYTFSANASHPGVPYIITSDISIPYSRQTVKEVYDGMIKDLTEALALFPISSNDALQMNKNAAKALLARIYLYKEDFENAKRLAIEVTVTNPLMSQAAGYPVDIFKRTTLPSSETMFQVAPLSYFGSSYFLGRVLVSPMDYVATSDVATILTEEANDRRSSWLNNSGSNLLVTKFPLDVAFENDVPVSTPASGNYYHCVLRSSEMFLTVAEAAFKLGDENIAREYIDAIRKRSNPAATSTTATGVDLLNLIYKERRKELCFEGERMNDLQRWKQGVHRTDAPVSYAKVLSYPSSMAIAPIPVADVELMKLSQNVDY